MKDNLSELLQSWSPKVSEPPGFKRAVWQRIEAAEAAKRNRLTEWLSEFIFAITQPKFAVVTAAIAILAGVGIGSGLAGSNDVSAYLRSVNPYDQISGK